MGKNCLLYEKKALSKNRHEHAGFNRKKSVYNHNAKIAGYTFQNANKFQLKILRTFNGFGLYDLLLVCYLLFELRGVHHRGMLLDR
jgi:hypothetical protein